MLHLLTHTIDRSAEHHAARPAVRFAGSELSYEQLVRRSNALARVLIQHGIRKGDRVGIAMNKCLECAVAIHGVIKAGAAYVPLDIDAPLARIESIIDSASITHLVSHPPCAPFVDRLITHAVPLRVVIGLDDIPDGVVNVSNVTNVTNVTWENVSAEDSDRSPDVGAMEQDLAYILFTSGSTGVPKGIMHTHRSALAWAEVAAKTYALTHEDRISNHAPLHFDLSTLDYFATPVVGATTVVIPEMHTRLPASLSKLIADERLSVYYTVPLALVHLSLHGALEKRDLSALRWVLFGGEPMPVKHLRALMARLPHAQFANVYGPTETNGCTHFIVPRSANNDPLADADESPLPIGDVYDNVEAIITDEDDQPVADGQSGELLIRAATRMAGYWAQPALTEAATYRRDMPGGREDIFHRTGDLVRRRPDGQLDLLGRKDRQIKTRGYRVELDEVEAALLRHAAVEEAAAYTIPDDDAGRLIAASIIVRSHNGSATPTAALWREHLAKLLPVYAIPKHIEVVQTFPRTSTGKIDRRALAEQAVTRIGLRIERAQEIHVGKDSA